jgi:hypothetical protein
VLTEAACDVLAERRRQIEVEGWHADHDDDAHEFGQLAIAASCYAVASVQDERTRRLTIPSAWPWAAEWWKPKDPRRDLVRAGALILAEIERLDRIDRLSTKGDAPTKEE